MLKPFLSLMALMLWSAPVYAVQVTGAEIVEYGLFQKPAPDANAQAPNSLTGEIHGVVEATLQKQTQMIVAAVGTSFGVRVKFIGEPQNEMITCSFRWLRPKLTDPSTGKTSESDEWKSQLRLGTARYAGYTFDAPWELVPGKWTLQAIYDGKVLAEKSFEVVATQASNQAMERTATRLVSTRRVATICFMFSTLAPGRRRSSCSR